MLNTADVQDASSLTKQAAEIGVTLLPGRNVSVQPHDVAWVVALHVRQVAPDPVEVLSVEGAPVERVGYHPLVRTPEVGSVTARRLVGSGLDYPTPTVTVQLDLQCTEGCFFF